VVPSCWIAARVGSIPIVEMLKEHHGANYLTCQDHGRTILHEAAIGGQIQMLQWLFDNGYKIEYSPKQGNFCLPFFILQCCQYKIIYLVIGRRSLLTPCRHCEVSIRSRVSTRGWPMRTAPGLLSRVVGYTTPPFTSCSQACRYVATNPPPRSCLYDFPLVQLKDSI